MAKVSVIIPCYNQGHYLARALDSILGQDSTDWEAIVVDDGSTDDTASVGQENGDARIGYVYQPNQGLSGARNTGLDLARAPYVAFLDADDEWEPTFLGRCLEALATSPEAVGAYTHNAYIDENGRLLGQVGGGAVRPGAFRRRLLEGGFFPPCAVMVRREALAAAGQFDTTLTSLEDWDLWLRLSERGAMIGIPEPLARYRVYPGSMSTDAERMQANRLAVLAKHFGPAEGEPQAWAEEKRYAYGFAQRSAGLAYLEQGQPGRCWLAMTQAAAYWPEILTRLDTYYELGCGGQMKGYRGRPTAAEIRANGALAIRWLEDLFGHGDQTLEAYRQRAFGQAYLALGMLADQAGDWALARSYLRRALSSDWRLVKERGVARRLVKVHLGQRVAGHLGGRPGGGQD